ncbi:MAG: DUF2227 family putative metal-binding protein [Candidatus Methanoperedens sp.]|nr:DUF2227 family putative metal-binding protein [Candidatus Methanoperedens sp.]MCZ7404141.1 DUF2227 family putative metal-binding protein [Candidatus Methanoperedens sp.]
MPGYNTHRIFNYVIFIAIAAFALYESINLKQLLALGIGFYIGTDFLTPDLDTESTAIKRLGGFKILFLPYKWAFAHRQSSHNIIYGAVVRILYISIIILVLYYVLFKSIPSGTLFFSVYSAYIIFFLIGIVIANALHVLLDGIF